MMMKCPRCGFSQPEDQYCAQCGVNMHSFKPKEKNIFAKLSENVAFQTVVLILVAATAGSYLIKKTSQSNWIATQTNKVSQFRINKNIQDSANSSTSSNLQTSDKHLANLEHQEIVIETNNTESLSNGQNSTTSGSQKNIETSALSTKNENTTDQMNQVLLKLTYAEISNDVYQKWITESSNAGMFQNLQDYSAGIITDFSKKNFKFLQNLKSSEVKLTSGQTETDLSAALNEDSQSIGLSIHFEIKSIDSGLARGVFTASRLSRQTRENFPAEFELPKGSAFFISDILSRQSFAGESHLLTKPPFQIFKSQNFMTQKSKFVIILESESK